MTKVVFSHGFGVKADARGMFTDIINTLPQHEFETFDYNVIDENGDIEVSPLNVQADTLQKILNKQKEEVVIVAHSQGCLIPGMINLKSVSKVILLAPPEKTGMQRVISKLMKKPDAEIDLNGISKFPRSDGTTTIISKEYIESITNLNALSLYQQVANSTPTVIVRCIQDEVLGLTNVTEVKNARHIDLKADHNFSGEARELLIDVLADELRI